MPLPYIHPYLDAYVRDLPSVVDLQAIAESKVHICVDPLGGASVAYWDAIGDRYELNLEVVSHVIDPTFRFMTVDWEGQIRMDPSSVYAMARMVGLKERFDVAFASDTDADRHGIVSRSHGLLDPNHHLSVAVLIEIDANKIIGRGFTGNLLVDPSALQMAIDRGLRGQLRMESFVTGLLYVALDQYPETVPHFVQPQGSRYREIPTVATELEQVQDEVRQAFTKLAKIDFSELTLAMTRAFQGVDRLANAPALNATLRSLEQTMPKFDEAIVNIRQLAVTLDKNTSDLSADLQQTSAATHRAVAEIEITVKQIGITMKEAEDTVISARAAIDPDSPIFYEVAKSLREISGAARSWRLLAGYLERNPRALIFGKTEAKAD